jgi:hypothetical protein
MVLKTTKSQSKIAMELLSMLPETVLGEHYRNIPKSLGNLLDYYDLYGRIVADTIQFQDTLRHITIMHCHPSIFDDLYDGGFRIQLYPLFTKYNEMDRRWKIIIFMTRLFNARKLAESPLYVELIFEVELGSPLIY